ncbi:HAMP domain-containing protein, partial [Patescibacteria group bacterium]
QHVCFGLDEEVKSEHRRDVLSAFANYRGVDVIGTHRYIPSVNWCLVVELGSSEAFVGANRVMLIGVIVLVIAIVVSLAVANYIGGVIGRPVEDLRRDIKIIEGGKLDHRIESERKDEIGELGNAYNKMADAVLKSKREADAKINEQTEKIQEKQSRLVAQNKELMKLKNIAEESVRKAEEDQGKLQETLDEASENKEALERMNDLMVGREMKMIELKEKLAELGETGIFDKDDSV